MILGVTNNPAQDEYGVLRIDFRKAVVSRFIEEQELTHRSCLIETANHDSTSESGGPAAIDEERVAGDEVGGGASEEDGGADEVGRLGEAA